MKKFYLLLLALISLNLAYADTEPTNNTAAGADAIALNGTVTGTITALDYDYYELITIQDGDITFSCSSTSPTSTTVVLVDSNGVASLNSLVPNNTTGTLSITTYALEAGHYFIYLLGNDAANYTLSNSFSGPSIANNTEPNSNASDAILLAIGDTASGHIGYRHQGGGYDLVDFYQINIPVDGDITINMSNDNGNYINFVLYDDDGTTLVNNLGALGQPGFSLTTVALAAGTYYINVHIDLTTQYSAYQLSTSFQPTTYLVDTEPNGTPAQATLINLNETHTGHIMHRNHGGGYDLADYYKIIMPSNSNISLPITNGNNNPIILALFDSSGTTYINSVYGPGQSGLMLNDSLGAGTYIIKVYADLGTQYSGYQFSSSSSVGVHEINSITSMELFPNPVTENLKLKFFNTKSGNAQVNIVNMRGEICYSENIFVSTGNAEVNIPVKNLSEGVYMLEVIADGSVSARRFVK